jgi:hypothetical protein
VFIAASVIAKVVWLSSSSLRLGQDPSTRYKVQAN